jgi:hypothetical protein
MEAVRRKTTLQKRAVEKEVRRKMTRLSGSWGKRSGRLLKVMKCFLSPTMTYSGTPFPPYVLTRVHAPTPSEVDSG